MILTFPLDATLKTPLHRPRWVDGMLQNLECVSVRAGVSMTQMPLVIPSTAVPTSPAKDDSISSNGHELQGFADLPLGSPKGGSTSLGGLTPLSVHVLFPDYFRYTHREQVNS